MGMRKRLVQATAAMSLAIFLPANVPAGDKSFSAVVKHIQSTYKARREGMFWMGFARLAVKIAKPAGVKNFKVVVLKDVDFTTGPEQTHFHSFLQQAVGSDWRPLVRYASQPGRQWTYVYAQQLPNDMKMLVISLQRREAYVVQFKFSPDRLIKFLEKPEIMGIRLGN